MWVYLAAAIVMVAGLGASVAVYLSAEQVERLAFANETGGGQVYVPNPSETKLYRRDLALFGGKFAIMADDFHRWFASQWEGKRLAWTTACLSLGVALLLLRVASRMRHPKRYNACIRN
jgi:hypothetical protein